MQLADAGPFRRMHELGTTGGHPAGSNSQTMFQLLQLRVDQAFLRNTDGEAS